MKTAIALALVALAAVIAVTGIVVVSGSSASTYGMQGPQQGRFDGSGGMMSGHDMMGGGHYGEGYGYNNSQGDCDCLCPMHEPYDWNYAWSYNNSYSSCPC